MNTWVSVGWQWGIKKLKSRNLLLRGSFHQGLTVEGILNNLVSLDEVRYSAYEILSVTK